MLQSTHMERVDDSYPSDDSADRQLSDAQSDSLVNQTGWRDSFQSFSGNDVVFPQPINTLKAKEVSVDRQHRSLILGSFVSGFSAITRPHEIPEILHRGIDALRRIARGE